MMIFNLGVSTAFVAAAVRFSSLERYSANLEEGPSAPLRCIKKPIDSCPSVRGVFNNCHRRLSCVCIESPVDCSSKHGKATMAYAYSLSLRDVGGTLADFGGKILTSHMQNADKNRFVFRSSRDALQQPVRFVAYLLPGPN
jgi:hypothetical protein